jgi:hypothetical protein
MPSLQNGTARWSISFGPPPAQPSRARGEARHTRSPTQLTRHIRKRRCLEIIQHQRYCREPRRLNREFTGAQHEQQPARHSRHQSPSHGIMLLSVGPDQTLSVAKQTRWNRQVSNVVQYSRWCYHDVVEVTRCGCFVLPHTSYPYLPWYVPTEAGTM